MGLIKKSEIKKLETKLKERYDSLLEKLSGIETSPNLIDVIDESQTVIDSHELRISIDDFSTILKEIKRVCK